MSGHSVYNVIALLLISSFASVSEAVAVQGQQPGEHRGKNGGPGPHKRAVAGGVKGALTPAPPGKQKKGNQHQDAGANKAAVKQSAQPKVAALKRAAETVKQKQPVKIDVPKEVQFNLMICNAYAGPLPLDAYSTRRGERLTTVEPIKYRDCQETKALLQEGDSIDFKARGVSGDLDVATFYATDLPKTNSSLLLIPHRRDNSNPMVVFESHAFGDLQSAQLAVVDAFTGTEESKVHIMDSRMQKTQLQRVTHSKAKTQHAQRTQELSYNSVLALTPGKYQVALGPKDGEATTLEAVPKAKYVVMRVGQGGDSTDFPEELIVFPKNAALTTAHRSAAVTTRGFMAVALAVLWSVVSHAV